MTTPELPGARRYMTSALERLDAVITTQAAAIDAAATAVTRTLAADGLVYLFGTGHSHMLAEEGHYRAGGLAAVVPVLVTSLMLHENAVASTTYERTPGLAAALLARYPLSARDVFIVFSNSGKNAVPVESARVAKAAGATVIAVVSLRHATQVPVGPAGEKLMDVADIVIDNCGVPGDALVALGEDGLRTGASSTLTGALILNAILTEAAWRLTEAGTPPPIYVSANLPGSDARNADLFARYRGRNPHL